MVRMPPFWVRAVDANDEGEDQDSDSARLDARITK